MVVMIPFHTLIFSVFLILNLVSSLPQSNVPHETCNHVDSGIDMCDYLTNDEMKKKIIHLHETYPKLVEIGNIGKSQLGEDLAYLKITSNKAPESLNMNLTTKGSRSRLLKPVLDFLKITSNKAPEPLNMNLMTKGSRSLLKPMFK